VEKTIYIEVSNYEILKSELSKGFDLSPLKIEFLSFWEKWGNLHFKLFKSLGIGVHYTLIDENELNLIAKKFMTKRRGMVSAFAQGIKDHPNFKSEIVLFRNIIKEHDEHFKILLTQILAKLLNELNQLQSLRKVSNAYMNSQLSLGG
jgi:hypothetical protein